jgi:hypothetical protein
MQWEASNRADPRAAALADLHYSRGKPGTAQFVQAAKCLVLVRPSAVEVPRHPVRALASPPPGYGQLRGADAVWVTTWPFAEYVQHEWGGLDWPGHEQVVERLIKVDPETRDCHRGNHRWQRPRSFVEWADDELVPAVRGRKDVTLRRAVLRETPGTWSCVMFRNESGVLSSDLIRQAVAATRAHWGEPPPMGMVTMIQADAVRSGGSGKSYIAAGFRHVGKTRTRPFKEVFLLAP